MNKSSHTLSVIQAESGTELREIPTGFAPHEVAVSQDGRTAYVTDYGAAAAPGNTISKIDLENGTLAGTLSLGGNTFPHGIAVAADASLWVTAEGSGRVLRVDGDDGSIIGSVNTNQAVTHMLVLAAPVGRLYTANIGSGSSTAVNTTELSVVRQIPTGAGAEGIDVSPDGSRVYVANREAGTLVEIDVATNEVTRGLAVGTFPIRVKIRPDGSEALLTDAVADELVAVSLQDWVVARRLPVGDVPIGLLITPDNRTAYVASTAENRVLEIDLGSWSVRRSILVGAEPDGLAWVEEAP